MYIYATLQLQHGRFRMPKEEPTLTQGIEDYKQSPYLTQYPELVELTAFISGLNPEIDESKALLVEVDRLLKTKNETAASLFLPFLRYIKDDSGIMHVVEKHMQSADKYMHETLLALTKQLQDTQALFTFVKKALNEENDLDKIGFFLKITAQFKTDDAEIISFVENFIKGHGSLTPSVKPIINIGLSFESREGIINEILTILENNKTDASIKWDFLSYLWDYLLTPAQRDRLFNFSVPYIKKEKLPVISYIMTLQKAQYPVDELLLPVLKNTELAHTTYLDNLVTVLKGIDLSNQPDLFAAILNINTLILAKKNLYQNLLKIQSINDAQSDEIRAKLQSLNQR